MKPTEVAVAPAGEPDLGQPLQPAIAAPASQPAVDPKTVVLTVGEEKITAGEFQQILSDLPPQTQAQVLGAPNGKRRLADELVNFKLMAAEAKKRHLEDSPKVRIAYQQALAQALMTSLSEDEAADQKYFNEHKSDFEQLKARHILIATSDSPVPAAKKLSDADAKAKATKIKARLDKGEDFAAIAKSDSDDTQSGAEGGSLGTFGRGQMVPAFEEVAFGLKKNQISEPVRTQFGYHIIQALDRVAPQFSDVRREVAQARLQGLLGELKKQDVPVYDDAYFGKAPATKPADADKGADAAPTTEPAAK